MKPSIQRLLDGNELYHKGKTRKDPEFFQRTSQGQQPKFLWVGCSDSRVDPNEITQTDVGELFVHRNIANLVVKTDLNFLSVLQYAVEVLKVEDIIVCGHYGCGGVNAAMKGDQLGLIDDWLAYIRSAYQYYDWELEPYTDPRERARKMVELNVLEQVNNLGKTSIIKEAWERGRTPAISGWVYDLENGKVSILHEEITDPDQLKLACKFERKLADKPFYFS
jgi:carbonic anhydrase